MSAERRPPFYTLDEARRELAREECERRGHDFNIVVDAVTGVPHSLTCQRCGRTWNVGGEQGVEEEGMGTEGSWVG